MPQPLGIPSDLVKLQFPNSDVKGVLEFYERLTKKHLVLDNQVQGTVNIVVPGEITREEAIRIIEINLLLNGFTLVPVERTDIVKVIGVGKNPRSAAIPIISDEMLLPEGEQVVTFIAKLEYADPQELQQALGTFIVPNQSQSTNLTALPKSRTLLITENSATIRGLLRIIHGIDVPPAEVVSEFVPLERADAKDVLEKLTSIFEKPTDKAQPVNAPARTVPRPAGTTPEGNPVPPGATAEMTSPNSVEIRGSSLSEDSIIIGKIKLTADVRTNRIHVVTRPVNLPFVRKLIHEFDSVVKFGEPTSRPLKYVSAGEVLDVVVKAITEPGAKEDTSSGGQGKGASGSKSSSGASAGASGGGGGGSGSSSVSVSEGLSTEPVDTTPEARIVGTTKIIADKNANAIIIIGNDDVKGKVLRLLDELDQRIPQVMLHTVIGELNLDHLDQYGVEYIIKKSGLGVSPLIFNGANGNTTGGTTTNDGTATGATAAATTTGTAATTTTATTANNNPSTFVNFSNGQPGLNLNNLLDLNKATQVATAGGGGLNAFLTAGNSLNAVVTALLNTSYFHVVSRPSVFTRNNKKAIIVSGQEIAVPTSIQSALGSTAGTSNNGLVTNSSVEFKTVALQLEVVPLINSDREVSLDILQKEDEVAGSTLIDNNSIPTIATRYIKTSVTVPNKSTLVLGGLIKVSQNNTKSGIPILSSIPVLGNLFSTTSKEKIRTELVILISPEVSWAPPDNQRIRRTAQKFLELEPDLEATIAAKDKKKTPKPGLFHHPLIQTRDTEDPALPEK